MTELKSLGNPRPDIVAIVGGRIGPECLAAVLEFDPHANFIVGITPRADRDAVARVIESYPDRHVEYGGASDVLRALSQGERAADWLLNLWGEIIIDPASLNSCASSLNIHPSMLPWARGSDPVVWTIMNGWPAGVTLHSLTTDVDAGPIWVQREVAYDLSTSGEDLYTRVLAASLKTFRDEWPRIFSGELAATPQVLCTKPARRNSLFESQHLDLEDPHNDGALRALRWIQALDFGDDFSARVSHGGHEFSVKLSVTRDAT